MGKTQGGERFFKIELNNQGDYVMVPIGNSDFYDHFAKGCKQIWGMAGGACSKLKKIERKYKSSRSLESDLKRIEETAKINVQFSKNAAGIIDNIFGEDTVRKYFYKSYEENPGFIPGVECFTDFLDQITPIMQNLLENRF